MTTRTSDTFEQSDEWESRRKRTDVKSGIVRRPSPTWGRYEWKVLPPRLSLHPVVSTDSEKHARIHARELDLAAIGEETDNETT